MDELMRAKIQSMLSTAQEIVTHALSQTPTSLKNLMENDADRDKLLLNYFNISLYDLYDSLTDRLLLPGQITSETHEVSSAPVYAPTKNIEFADQINLSPKGSAVVRDGAHLRLLTMDSNGYNNDRRIYVSAFKYDVSARTFRNTVSTRQILTGVSDPGGATSDGATRLWVCDAGGKTVVSYSVSVTSSDFTVAPTSTLQLDFGLQPPVSIFYETTRKLLFVIHYRQSTVHAYSVSESDGALTRSQENDFNLDNEISIPESGTVAGKTIFIGHTDDDHFVHAYDLSGRRKPALDFSAGEQISTDAVNSLVFYNGVIYVAGAREVPDETSRQLLSAYDYTFGTSINIPLIDENPVYTLEKPNEKISGVFIKRSKDGVRERMRYVSANKLNINVADLGETNQPIYSTVGGQIYSGIIKPRGGGVGEDFDATITVQKVRSAVEITSLSQEPTQIPSESRQVLIPKIQKQIADRFEQFDKSAKYEIEYRDMKQKLIEKLENRYSRERYIYVQKDRQFI